MENSNNNTKKYTKKEVEDDDIHYTQEQKNKIKSLQEDLPIYPYKQKILKTLLNNNVSHHNLKKDVRNNR